MADQAKRAEWGFWGWVFILACFLFPPLGLVALAVHLMRKRG